MKTAFILYGFFRTFEFCKNSLNTHILNVLNPDIFINSPNTIYTKPEHEVSEWQHLYSRNTNSTIETIASSFLLDQLKSCEIRGYNSQFYYSFIDKNNITHITDIGQYSWRIASTLHSISLATKTFENYINVTGEKYDLVILTRPDLRYYRNFDSSILDLNKINYPAYHMCAPDNPSLFHLDEEVKKQVDVRIRSGGAGIFGFPGQWFNDQFICGTQENILKFSNIFDMIVEYYNDNVFLNTETYLGVHCMKNNINFIGTDFTTYEMWRPNKAEY